MLDISTIENFTEKEWGIIKELKRKQNCAFVVLCSNCPIPKCGCGCKSKAISIGYWQDSSAMNSLLDEILEQKKKQLEFEF